MRNVHLFARQTAPMARVTEPSGLSMQSIKSSTKVRREPDGTAASQSHRHVKSHLHFAENIFHAILRAARAPSGAVRDRQCHDPVIHARFIPIILPRSELSRREVSRIVERQTFTGSSIVVNNTACPVEPAWERSDVRGLAWMSAEGLIPRVSDSPLTVSARGRPLGAQF
jgi:hypothetical protein